MAAKEGLAAGSGGEGERTVGVYVAGERDQGESEENDAEGGEQEVVPAREEVDVDLSRRGQSRSKKRW